jgi:C-3',4' desaturase CrtD
MEYEVIVVGGGVGGLTTAALLAARGMSVCLAEREPRAGGCAVTFPASGFEFEAGAGLYASWDTGEIHDRVFSELPVVPPEVGKATPAYLVRLPDGSQVPVSEDNGQFEETLAAAFPECARAAVDFYREIAKVGTALQRINSRIPDLRTSPSLYRFLAAAPDFQIAARVYRGMNQTAAGYLAGTSQRFQRFIDVQLQIFGQHSSDKCAYLYAAIALMVPRIGMYAIKGGASGLSDLLVESIKQSGGTVRFNTPVLRLAYGNAGQAIGVDLLNGERVLASRAIVSNLPVWDTYGKLVGVDRTPDQIRKRIRTLSGWGAYSLYLGIEEEAARRLPAEHILALADWQEGKNFDPEGTQFMFGVAPSWDPRGPAGKRAVTVSTFTEASQWFSYHESEEEHEAQDQSTLEQRWAMIHKLMPELGDAVEVIETATPRTYYDNTRRKLGMVGGIGQSLEVFAKRALSHRTPIRNLFLVGDTVFPGQGVAGVTQSGLIVANEIAPRGGHQGN